MADKHKIKEYVELVIDWLPAIVYFAVISFVIVHLLHTNAQMQEVDRMLKDTRVEQVYNELEIYNANRLIDDHHKWLSETGGWVK